MAGAGGVRWKHCPPSHPPTPLEGVGPFRRKSRKTLLPQPPWLGLGESGGSTVHRLTPPHLWRVWVHSGGGVEDIPPHSYYVRAAAPLSGASPALRQAELVQPGERTSSLLCTSTPVCGTCWEGVLDVPLHCYSESSRATQPWAEWRRRRVHCVPLHCYSESSSATQPWAEWRRRRVH
jgi:hypothetical protein